MIMLQEISSFQVFSESKMFWISKRKVSSTFIFSLALVS